MTCYSGTNMYIQSPLDRKADNQFSSYSLEISLLQCYFFKATILVYPAVKTFLYFFQIILGRVPPIFSCFKFKSTSTKTNKDLFFAPWEYFPLSPVAASS